MKNCLQKYTQQSLIYITCYIQFNVKFTIKCNVIIWRRILSIFFLFRRWVYRYIWGEVKDAYLVYQDYQAKLSSIKTLRSYNFFHLKYLYRPTQIKCYEKKKTIFIENNTVNPIRFLVFMLQTEKKKKKKN